mmetsp:Transcript_48008/g.88376  ORF Transcript_48008/g.88376 Transcript_48008/m.88376 type:complete len:438 (-) Transcript_48008:45-1358(-)
MLLHSTEGLTRREAAKVQKLNSLAPASLQLQGCDRWDISEHVTEDGWAIADFVPMQRHNPALSSAWKETALGIEHQLHFHNVDCRATWFGLGQRFESQNSARRILERALLRFAMLELQFGDPSKLDAWCLYLRRILEQEPFLESNWLGGDKFERRLQACLAYLEVWRGKIKGDTSTGLALLEHMDAREAAQDLVESRRLAKASAGSHAQKGGSTLMTSMALTFHRRVAAARVPRLIAPIAHEAWKRASFFALQLSILGQLVDPISAYASGQTDAAMFGEEVLHSLSGTAVLLLLSSIPSPLSLLLGGSSWSIVAQMVPYLAGPGFLPAIMADTLMLSIHGSVNWYAAEGVRAASKRLRRDQGLRKAQQAYEALGLCGSGSKRYTPSEVHAQLAWRLQQKCEEPIQLWIAYEQILQFHLAHPLHNPAWHCEVTPTLTN